MSDPSSHPEIARLEQRIQRLEARLHASQHEAREEARQERRARLLVRTIARLAQSLLPLRQEETLDLVVLERCGYLARYILSLVEDNFPDRPEVAAHTEQAEPAEAGEPSAG